MTLTTAQVEQFRAHGYVAVPTVFDAEETAAVRAEVERLQRDGLLRNVATDGDGTTTSQTKRNLQLCPMFDKSALFRALPFAPKSESVFSSPNAARSSPRCSLISILFLD